MPNICKIQKVLFLTEIFESEISMDLHVLRSPETKKSRLACVCVYYQHNSKAYNIRMFKFGILYLYHTEILLETFDEVPTNSLCTGAHKRVLMHQWAESSVRIGSTSSQKVLSLKLQDERCRVQSPVRLVDLAARFFHWFSFKFAQISARIS